MTKEEKIKEAWVNIYGEYKYNLIKYAIKDNGYIDCNRNPEVSKIIDTTMKGIFWGTTDYMPLSLKGIEDNNGWIKIESEDDLPISGDLYFCKLAPNAWDNEDYIYYLMKYFHKSVPHKLKRALEYTHYQPIEKPKPPIY